MKCIEVKHCCSYFLLSHVEGLLGGGVLAESVSLVSSSRSRRYR